MDKKKLLMKYGFLVATVESLVAMNKNVNLFGATTENILLRGLNYEPDVEEDENL